MAKSKKRLEDYAYYEAIDRTSMVTHMVELYVAQHPAIQEHKKFRKKAEKVVQDLSNLYFDLGTLINSKPN